MVCACDDSSIVCCCEVNVCAVCAALWFTREAAPCKTERKLNGAPPMKLSKIQIDGCPVIVGEVVRVRFVVLVRFGSRRVEVRIRPSGQYTYS